MPHHVRGQLRRTLTPAALLPLQEDDAAGRREAREAAFADARIKPGQQTVDVHVQVTWELR